MRETHIIRLCEICSQIGVAFVKTSTGYGFVKQDNGMYAYKGATVDHLKEYGTLKAIGAANRYIYRVITQQALASAVAGFGVGIALALAVSHASLRGTTAILIPWQLTLTLALATAGCGGHSLRSIIPMERPPSRGSDRRLR